ncbi:MAG TPA: flagellar motor switch protein FliN [Terracidiphilus sp.]|nr:flagellar motor switch protein FliN [Terracidiphilus sp.]
MENQTKKKRAETFAAAFADALSESLGSAIGASLPLKPVDSLAPAANRGTPVHLRLTVDGSISGDCFVELYEPQVAELVSKIVKEPVTDLSEQHIEALVKVFASAAAGLASSLATTHGKLNFKVERVAGLAFGGMFVVPLAATQEPSSLHLLLYFGGQLLEGLSTDSEAQPVGKSADSLVPPKNLKLVMDVELNVSLRFGQRQMPLREVLELGSGSVIELDRMVDEPVELFLDGKLIARGEAVVVDGNYGLRVTEIPQPVTSHLLN